MALWLLVLLAAAEAEDGDDYEVIVRERPAEDGLDAQRRLDDREPGFASGIEIDFESGARPADALPEVLTRSPAANVRSVGGLGQFSSVSLRGSSGQQVAVFLDGVPLGSSFAGLVNLGDIPLDTLGRIEVFRGFVPVEFGSAAVGGAVNLVGEVHRGAPRLQLDGGLGSFATHHARARYAHGFGDDSLSVHLGYAGSAGDFDFYDNRATPQLDDDGTSTRVNNDYRRVLGQLRWDGRADLWRYAVTQIALVKEQGIAGDANTQAQSPRLDTLQVKNLGTVKRVAFGGPGGRLELVWGAGFEHRRFVDPDGEVGLAVDDETTRTVDAYLSPRWRVPLWTDAFLTVVADGRVEWVDVDNRLAPSDASGDATRYRFAYGAGVELEQQLFNGRLQIVPIVRIDAVDARFRVAAGEGELADAGRDVLDVAATARAGARFDIIDGVQVRASAGRYFRPPTLLELFGDRGFIVGNEGLEPERGTSLDAGFTVDLGAKERFAAYFQVAGFANWSSDLIQWFQTGPVVRPTNVPGARHLGLEVGASARAWGDRVRVQSAYTLLDSENQSTEAAQRGQPLPGRPRHQLYARISAGYAIDVVEPRAFVTAEHLSGSFLDASGRYGVPPRTLLGVGVELRVGDAVRVSVEARNLLDVRETVWRPPVRGAPDIPVPISGFIGYPLPGRSLWAALSFDAEYR